jgi:hypothetical protein
MENEKENFNPIDGFLIIDNIPKMQDPDLIALFLMGALDVKIKSTLFFKKEGRKAENKEELESNVLVNTALDFLKKDVRAVIQKSIDLNVKNDLKISNANFKEQNKVSSLGTISEICEKYNLSKKKVRDLKKNGELESYISNL